MIFETHSFRRQANRVPKFELREIKRTLASRPRLFLDYSKDNMNDILILIERVVDLICQVKLLHYFSFLFCGIYEDSLTKLFTQKLLIASAQWLINNYLQNYCV